MEKKISTIHIYIYIYIYIYTDSVKDVFKTAKKKTQKMFERCNPHFQGLQNDPHVQ